MGEPSEFTYCQQQMLSGAYCVKESGHDGSHRSVESTIVRSEQMSKTEELTQWWRDKAESEIDQTVRKAVEYSGTGGGLPQDLVDLGRQWAFAAGLDGRFTDAQLAEVGVWTYMVGKMGRWSSALRNGRMVSDDGLLDLGIYVRIVQAIRDRGQWP